MKTFFIISPRIVRAVAIFPFFTIFTLLTISSCFDPKIKGEKYELVEKQEKKTTKANPEAFAFEEKTKKKHRSMAEKEDGMMQAVLQELELTKDPATGEIPIKRLLQAKEYADNLRLNKAAISGINWTERGPNNVGGRTRALIFDKNDVTNKKVWAGGVGGGLWYTNDITVSNPTWNKINDFFDNIAISSLAQDPTTPNNMYFGTGEGWYNSDAIRGLGVWKSANGGTSWAQVASTNNSTFYHIQKIVVNTNGDIYVCTRAGGLQKSTNGGTSWTKVLGSGVGGASNDATDIEIAANGDIYVSFGIFATGMIFKSSFATHGSNTGNTGNWTQLTLPAGTKQRIELACAPSNSSVVCALFDDSNQGNFMRTTDGGSTWSASVSPQMCDQGTLDAFTRSGGGSQAWYDLTCAIDPNDANTVIIGGIDLLRSTDGGSTWGSISVWSGYTNGISSPCGFSGSPKSVVHADQHAIIYLPGSSSTVLFGNDGGVFYTTNATATSPTINSRNSGYNVTQYYACAIHPTSSSNYFLAGAQDNGTHRLNSAGIGSGTNVSGGDGAFCHIDQDNPNNQISAYTNHSYYVSTNGGSSFTNYSTSGGSFINPTDYDNTADLLYCCNGTTGYTRMTLAGAFTNINHGLSIGTMTHIKISPATANRIYFGTDGGKIRRVDNANTGAPTYTNLDPSAFLPNGSISCIAVDAANENNIAVSFSNYGLNSLWLTNNGGTSWTSIEGNMPDMPIRWIIFHPESNDQAIVATELGVWSCDNLNGTSTVWNATNTGLANARVDMIEYRPSDRTLLAATHGRGAFTAYLPTLTPQISFQSASTTITEVEALGTCPDYTDYTVTMSVSKAPSITANVTVSVAGGGSATQGSDYDFTTNGNFASPSSTVTFPSGSQANQTFTLRIYNDAAVESAESFTFNFSIAGGTDAVTGSNTTNVVTINDNDAAPIAYVSADRSIGSGTSLLQVPFMADNQDCRTQMIYTAAELTTAGFQIGDKITSVKFNIIYKYSTQPYSNFTVKLKNTSSTTTSGTAETGGTTVYSNNLTTDPGVNILALTSNFNWDGTSNLLVDICFDNTTSTDYDLIYATNINNLCNFGFSSAGEAGCGFNSIGYRFVTQARPNITFTTERGSAVENTLTSVDETLGPNADVYFYSPTGKIMARILNLSSHDYGCTSVSIDRTGTGAQFISGETAVLKKVMNKTFRVIPTTNNPTGSYQITYYITSAEKTGFETEGRTWASQGQLFKTSGSINAMTTSTARETAASTSRGTFGTSHTITAIFDTGFSGSGVGTPGSALPVELMSFSGKKNEKNNELNWVTATEKNTSHFEIERSDNAVNFERIANVQAAGYSMDELSYQFLDVHFSNPIEYYRLKMIDLDGSFDYSNIVAINRGKNEAITIYPNPANDKLTVSFERNQTAELILTDMTGRVVISQQLTESQSILDTDKLPNGVYVLSMVQNGVRSELEKIVIKH